MAIRDDLGPTFLPAFTPIADPAPTLDDGSPMPSPEPTPTGPARLTGAPPESRSSMFGAPPSPRLAEPDDATTRTENSSGGSRIGDPKQTAKVIAGLVGLLFSLAAGIAGQRRLTVRRPSRRQLDGFADPVGQIIARHTDLASVTPDLADVILAGAAVGDYMTDGPVLARTDPQYLDDDQGDEPDPAPAPAPPPAETPTVTYL